ncbi:hypothetical protein [Angustibacter sp. Root456]|uniref:hypothetical protein n=1 Tax=Angustibacter sp. Root456 TaxID=1736539 RepID=UPI0006FA632A|nr:hypothetical protein [Angustibacter sp. Root456]KQX69561.1 hypothetical protein ASD06_00375 [Angustibacter sp. Root456]
MTVLIIGMLVTLLIAGVVVAMVAVPAYREGRDVLSREGEQLVQTARERTVEAVGTAREKVGERVGDLAERLPNRSADAEPTYEPAPSAALGPQEIDLREPATTSSTESAERRHRA